jgi:hypothetical protein
MKALVDLLRSQIFGLQRPYILVDVMEAKAVKRCRLDRRPRLKREQEKIVTRAFACSSRLLGGSRTAGLLN